METVDQEFATAAACLVATVHQIQPGDWDKPGLGEWTVRDLVGHASRALSTVEQYLGHEPATDAPRLVDAVISRGPFVRFAWGVSMGDRLDHHPNAPADQDRAQATPFDPDGAFLRVERQTLTGFPGVDGALFTIRPYIYPLREAVKKPQDARSLAAALRTMTPAQVQYKGLSVIGEDLLTWLDARAEKNRG